MDEAEVDESTAASGSESDRGGGSSVTTDAAEAQHVAIGEDERAPTAPAAGSTASERIERIIESVLFASAAPVSLRRLVDILAGPSTKEVLAAVNQLMREYAPGHRGIQLREVAGGYQFRTARENAEWVRAVFREKPARLGRAALETLAIVAYKQPVTRAEIEAIRGVDVDGVLSTLMSRRLIKITGRKEAVGRPLLYGTTAEFLEVFGFRDLHELPSLKELGPAPDADDEGVSAQTAEQERPTPDDAAEATADTGTTPPSGAAEAGAPAEDSQPGGDRVEAESGGVDPSGACAAERPGSDPAGDEGEPPNGSHRD
jgi:segregation and condensation protein B